jgi:flagellar biosynthesis GTPase FlhF
MTSKQCSGITASGNRCKRTVKDGNFCISHKPLPDIEKKPEVEQKSQKCAGITTAGTSCTLSAIAGFTYCKFHIVNHDNTPEESKSQCTGLTKKGTICTRTAVDSRYCKSHSAESDKNNKLELEGKILFCEYTENPYICVYSQIKDSQYCKKHTKIFKPINIPKTTSNSTQNIDWSAWDNSKIVWPEIDNYIYHEPSFQYEQNYKEWKKDESKRIKELQEQKAKEEAQKQEEQKRRQQEQQRRQEEQQQKQEEQKRRQGEQQRKQGEQQRKQQQFDNNKLNSKFRTLKFQIQKQILEALVYFEFTTKTINYNSIKAIYRKKVFVYHPDKGGDPEQFKILQGHMDMIDLLYE